MAGASNIHKNNGGGSGSSGDVSDKDEDKDKNKNQDKDKTNDGKDTEDKNNTNKRIRKHKVIQHLNNKWINQFNLNININIKITKSFSLFGLVFSQLNLNVDETASNLTQFSYGIFFIDFDCFNLFYKCTRIYDDIYLNSTRRLRKKTKKKYPKLRILIN